MPPPDIETLARNIVPGEGAVTLRRLGMGLVYSTYGAVRSGAEYALRVPIDNAPSSEVLAWEIRVLEQAGRMDLAPPLVLADAASGVLLSRWVVGEPWGEAAAASPRATTHMAQLLRAVHSLPIPAAPRRMDAADWIESYTRALSPPPASATGRLAAAAAQAYRAWQPLAGPEAPVICHSDLHRLNVLSRGEGAGAGRLLLLDWEYAHVTDGYWDLAGWSANNDLPEAAERSLLASYLGAPPSEAQWLRFRLQYWLYDYICLLWIGLYVRLRPLESAAMALRAGRLESRLKSAVYGTITG